MNKADQHGELFERWHEAVKVSRPRTPFEMVGAGVQLMVIKATTRHGEFMPTVNSMGLRSSEVSKLIRAARLFDLKRHAALLTAIGSCSKMEQMLVLEKEEIDHLSERGVIGPRKNAIPDEGDGRSNKQVRANLTMDAIANMNVIELRGAIRGVCGHAVASKESTVRLAPIEERLLRHYRQCRPDGRELVAKMAELLAVLEPAPKP